MVTGALIGFAFLAKMLQAFTVLPAFAGVYLLAAPTGLWRRVRQLALMGVAVVVSAGWWVAAVALWPVASRPMIDGSPDNSIRRLTRPCRWREPYVLLSSAVALSGAGSAAHL